ncbi:hypothetical protein L915_07962 [Phytophthora nicotianae]|uniref:Uncharacterized protein n=1 Tax=Phytophthora nicotianae TaxID=4792 RepID=W2GZ86_PHYNI|nr:hypothetical protein L915_07962 [Phytophthora nicotianae]
MASLAKQPVNCIRGGRNELDATIHSFRHVLFLERTQSAISKIITSDRWLRHQSVERMKKHFVSAAIVFKNGKHYEIVHR